LLLVAGTTTGVSAGVNSVARIGTVVSATARQCFVPLSVATALVVASDATTTIANTTTAFIAVCSAATLLEHQDKH
jgi:hypothetical protein